MYQGMGSGPKVVAPIAAGVTPFVLPNTGGHGVVTLALAVGAGLLTWGVLYARSSR
jgi:LPXTG-motif cell wall-anchored protein